MPLRFLTTHQIAAATEAGLVAHPNSQLLNPTDLPPVLRLLRLSTKLLRSERSNRFNLNIMFVSTREGREVRAEGLRGCTPTTTNAAWVATLCVHFEANYL